MLQSNTNYFCVEADPACCMNIRTYTVESQHFTVTTFIIHYRSTASALCTQTTTIKTDTLSPRDNPIALCPCFPGDADTESHLANTFATLERRPASSAGDKVVESGEMKAIVSR